MATGTSQPGQIHLQIIDVMKRFPEGISGGQIRQELEKEGLRPEDQTHLDRRMRELDEWFIIEKSVIAQDALRKWRHTRKKELLSQILTAQVLYAARGRCQRCGKTIETHCITLVVEPKNKRERIGIDDWGDYWAICKECSAARRTHLVRPIATGARPRFKCCRMSTFVRQSQHKP
ncbi:MAG: hypothetical protein WAO35_28230 [Terriglobia bacterium]